MENNVEMPTKQYVDMLLKSTNPNHNYKIRSVVIDWMYDVLTTSFKDYVDSFGYTVSLYDLYCSKITINNSNTAAAR